jgi:hypothetical protein
LRFVSHVVRSTEGKIKGEKVAALGFWRVKPISKEEPSGLNARGPISQAHQWRLKVMTIDDLVQQIEETERLIVVYRNADEVVVGTEDQIYSRRGLINRTIFTAAEIGDQIVNILERRLVTMRAQLKERGAEDLGQGR